jgi:hypothetical protein
MNMQDEIKKSIADLIYTLRDLEDTEIPENKVEDALELLGYLEEQVTHFMFELTFPSTYKN